MVSQNSKEQQHAQLRKIAESQLPPTSIIIAYMEHQMDLVAKVVDDIIITLDEGGALEKLTDVQRERIGHLRSVLEFSSIDFNNIDVPTQSYKLPKMKINKSDTRVVQERYLIAQKNDGIL